MGGFVRKTDMSEFSSKWERRGQSYIYPRATGVMMLLACDVGSIQLISYPECTVTRQTIPGLPESSPNLCGNFNADLS